MNTVDENIVEITRAYCDLVKEGKLTPGDDGIDSITWNQEIVDLAYGFEGIKNETLGDYFNEIYAFSRERLIEFSKEAT